ncbi:unnamed protein product, partial [Adineta steineri]
RIDILRFACCDNSTTDQYINLDKSNLEEARTFCDELWVIIRSTMSKNLDINDLECFQPPAKFTLTGTEEFSNHKLFALYLLSKHSVGDEHKYN